MQILVPASLENNSWTRWTAPGVLHTAECLFSDMQHMLPLDSNVVELFSTSLEIIVQKWNWEFLSLPIVSSELQYAIDDTRRI